MSARARVRLRRGAFGAALTPIGFLFVAATYAGQEERLYLAKWIGCGVLIVWLLVAARGRLARDLAVPFALVVGVSVTGMVAQLGDNIDPRALQLALGYVLTAFVAFVAAPAALRRRWVRASLWRGLVTGVLAGVTLAMALGVLHPELSLIIGDDRVRYKGYFERVNSAGWYGFVGTVLSVAAAVEARRARYFLLVPLFVIPAYLANSRGALVAMVALAVLWPLGLLARLSRRQQVVVTIALGCVAAGTLIAGDWEGLARLLQFGPGELDSLTSGRWSNWARSLAYLDAPARVVFGLGLGRNVAFVPGNYGLRGGEGDNFYVDLVGRAGLIGLALFLVMAGLVGARLLQRLRHCDRRSLPSASFAVALLGATALYGIAESHLLTSGTLHALVAWSFMGRAAISPLVRFPPSPEQLPSG